jgi:DNA invertase Pin-like site-specific DNA recombinase
MKMIGYVRVSTQEQGGSGAGLAAQRKAIEALCESRSWELARFERDVMSGSTTRRRPGLARALESCASGEVDGLIVAKLDRLSRSLLDFSMLVEQAQVGEWTLVSAGEGFDLSTSHGRMVASMLATFAAFERDLISERTKAALAVKRAEGVRLGRPSVLDDEVRKRIIDLRSEGLSLQAIAVLLNEDGVQGAHGGRWHPTSVRRALN